MISPGGQEVEASRRTGQLAARSGRWQPLTDALGLKVDSLVKVVNARGRDMTARLTDVSIDVSIDDLLSGTLLSPRTCPHCGRALDESDFVDEETVIEDGPPRGRAQARQVAGTECATDVAFCPRRR